MFNPYILTKDGINMKKALKLEGLDCANCAAKIERDVSKLNGVNKASVSLMTQRMIIEAEDSAMPAVIESAKKIVIKYEPDVVIR